MEKNINRLTFADLRQIIVFGFDPVNRKFVYIDNCKNGLNCGLVCKFCGNQLSAKNNCITKRNHFAHKAGSDCKKGHESTIPLLLKKILENHKEIQLPTYHYPYDSSIVFEYKKMNISSVDIEKYEDDLSFNVIVKTNEGMEIAIIPYMKSNDIFLRRAVAKNRYKNVLTIDFEAFKNSRLFIEDIIEEIVEQRRHMSTCSWVANEKEQQFKEIYDLKCKKREEERQRQIQEMLEQRKRPVIINGRTYYRIEGVESFASSKKRVIVESKDFRLMYVVDFSNPYKTDDGFLKGYRLDDDGVVASELEIIKYQKNCLWIVH